MKPKIQLGYFTNPYCNNKSHNKSCKCERERSIVIFMTPVDDKSLCAKIDNVVRHLKETYGAVWVGDSIGDHFETSEHVFEVQYHLKENVFDDALEYTKGFFAQMKGIDFSVEELIDPVMMHDIPQVSLQHFIEGKHPFDIN